MKKTFTFILALTLLTIVGATAQNHNGNSTNANSNANATGNVSTVTGDPSVFGNKVWNVYIYNGNQVSSPATVIYSGYYTENNLNFDSRKRYPYSNGNNAVPSNANSSTGNAYAGLAVGTVHTVDYKRAGFVEGFYQIDVPTLDDKGSLFINGVEVWSFNGCCQSHTAVWKGFLNAASTVELKYVNLASGGAGAMNFKTYDNTALPVSFSNFTVTKNNSTAQINWSTASETNNNFFTVEKSNDGVNFEMITTVKGAGNSNTVIAYNVVDNSLTAGTSYYRIKQTDFDNNSTYSAIVSISNSNNSQLSVYPNPVNAGDEIQVTIVDMKDAQITVRDLQGMDYFSGNATGTDSFSINTNHIAPGMYIVTVASENNHYSQKVIVK
jgi:hypothetical protein